MPIELPKKKRLIKRMEPSKLWLMIDFINAFCIILTEMECRKCTLFFQSFVCLFVCFSFCSSFVRDLFPETVYGVGQGGHKTNTGSAKIKVSKQNQSRPIYKPLFFFLSVNFFLVILPQFQLWDTIVWDITLSTSLNINFAHKIVDPIICQVA